MFPPRPKGRLLPAQLASYDNGAWVAQRKFNGTRTLIHITPEGKVAAYRPGKQPHEQWDLTPSVVKQFLSLNIERGLEYWLDGELLNNKTSSDDYKNKIVLYDVLQAGKYLFNVGLLERLKILTGICRNPAELEPKQGIAYRVCDNIWMAETFESDFVARFKDKITLDEIEGLVLKKRKSKLDNFGKKLYEVGWLLRVRKEHKNYIF